MKCNQVTFLARSSDERECLLADLRVADLIHRASQSVSQVVKTAVITEDTQEAIYIVRDERLIRILDAVIREA